MEKEQTGRQKYFYFVDKKKYEAESSSITGAMIKAKINLEPTSQLFLESSGNDPDKQVSDEQSFSLEQKPLHFYTVPAATFG